MVLGLDQLIFRAKVVWWTPAKTHPFESTPPNSFAQRTLRAQHPPRRIEGTALTGTYPDEDFVIKIRPSGEEHRYFSI